MTDPTPTTTAALQDRLRLHAYDLVNGGTNASDLRNDLNEAASALAASERAQTSIRDLVVKWREKANQSGLEATRIYNTVKVHTDAQERCYARADVWKKCADELDATLSASAPPASPQTKEEKDVTRTVEPCSQPSGRATAPTDEADSLREAIANRCIR